MLVGNQVAGKQEGGTLAWDTDNSACIHPLDSSPAADESDSLTPQRLQTSLMHSITEEKCKHEREYEPAHDNDDRKRDGEPMKSPPLPLTNALRTKLGGFDHGNHLMAGTNMKMDMTTSRGKCEPPTAPIERGTRCKVGIPKPLPPNSKPRDVHGSVN